MDFRKTETALALVPSVNCTLQEFTSQMLYWVPAKQRQVLQQTNFSLTPTPKRKGRGKPMYSFCTWCVQVVIGFYKFSTEEFRLATGASVPVACKKEVVYMFVYTEQ